MASAASTIASAGLLLQHRRILYSISALASSSSAHLSLSAKSRASSSSSSSSDGVTAIVASASAPGACFTSSGRRIGWILPRRLLIGASFIGLMDSNAATSSSPAIAKSKSSEVEEVLKNVDWPSDYPYKKEDFQRYDESPDTIFYSSPRFVTHIDDAAISALTKYYGSVFPPSNTAGVALLDLCSSWVSHYPKGYKQDRIVGLGLNEQELQHNEVLTEYAVKDLNANPKLRFEDNSFDLITNVVSVDYLTRPLEVFKEMNRVLKPGGLACMSFSNRCFWTKAISIWTSTGDVDHAWIVGSYFHYAGGFEPPQALDISPNPGKTDPMYVVYSKKLQ
ncbi:hypothetical protein O6H91_20G043500 [Diphasiastrum complanatum]|uniref:Uncharacterized protein n=1 Tax=Diphasiastrum complanatum TaxID=34168 RepID=A0ACC2APU3_DIPCM|nr:hypothetical protein O6H91_20G043500 [Diphasiastrum complanatum]